MANEKNYMKHITTEYDEKFGAVKDIKWDPWVGKNYAKTGILIMGESTYYGDDESGSGRSGEKTAITVETRAVG